ncbi:MAG: T9SS type A sorting domain-containing protein [Candidatus Marinimicrobia bacterium]|nr:T9SS type A sorting domain-containing protein [Candidatus Neomarinimicrobiota bacterium]MCF7922209.1 T9SS type A sorting domain-containing protein [Candidatus Neomarinimicrobiota bacterium]
MIRFLTICHLCLLPLSIPAQVNTGDTLQIVFVGGQSNALNLHADASLLPPSDLDSAIFYYLHSGLAPDQTSEPFIATSNNTWICLQVQVQTPYVALYSPFFGPEMTTARTMSAAGIENLGIFKVAYAGTHLAHDWKQGDHSMADAYEHFLNQLATATDSLVSWGMPWKFIGMCWMQGESDAEQLSWANAYESNLNEFIANIRLDLANPKLPVILGKVANQGGYPYLDQIRAAQEAVAASDSLVTLVSLDDQPLESDGVHFTAPGVQVMGARFGSALLDYLGIQPASIENNTIPQSPTLVNLFPNPFNSEVIIDVSTPSAQEVNLSIYDISGKAVISIFQGNLPAGTYRFIWDGHDRNHFPQPTGIYLFALQTETGTFVSKLSLLK